MITKNIRSNIIAIFNHHSSLLRMFISENAINKLSNDIGDGWDNEHVGDDKATDDHVTPLFLFFNFFFDVVMLFFH